MTLNRQNLAKLLATTGLVASLFLAGAATAEGGGGPRGGGHGGAGHFEKRIEKMQSELGLSADQVTRIKAIVDANKAEMKTLRDQMQATFTPEQQAQMKAWREQAKGKEKGQRPDREAMKAKWDQLGLSDGQRQQLKSYREQIKTKRESIRSQIQAVLTPEQQAKMEAKKAEWKGKHGGNHGRRQRGQSGEGK